MSIARIFAQLVCYILLASPCHCTPLRHRNGGSCTVKYVSIVHMDDSDFKTIGEYLLGGEKTYFRCLSRDDNSLRTGTYFIIGLSRKLVKLPMNLFIKISILRSLCDTPQVFTFNVPNERSAMSSEIYCGITSTPLDIAKINAWKVECTNSSGEILFSKTSYMWL